MWDKLPFYALVTVILGVPIVLVIYYLISSLFG